MEKQLEKKWKLESYRGLHGLPSAAYGGVNTETTMRDYTGRLTLVAVGLEKHRPYHLPGNGLRRKSTILAGFCCG